MRRTQIIIAALALALLYALFLALTLDTESNPGQSKASVTKDENKPVRVSVNPGGRPAFMNARVEAPDGASAPTPTYEKNELLEKITPFLGLIAPIGAAFFLLGRVGTSARGKLAELNLGVYKGAMPYEMHTARAYKQVFTHRKVDAHVFGRQREDFVFGTYLLPPSPQVRRLLGEAHADAAGVTRLAQGGARRPVPLKPQRSSPARLWKDTTGAAKAAVGARIEALQRERATRQKIERLRRRAQDRP